MVADASLAIKMAEEQGVLAPPPAGAGRVRRLWHHAKELFVCPHITLRTMAILLTWKNGNPSEILL
jgi:hypothetical protein